MRQDYMERQSILGQYIVEHRCTVRDAAAKFSISKSTVHKDVTEKLKKSDPILYREVKNILDINKAERHLRGGEATKRKYLSKSQMKQQSR